MRSCFLILLLTLILPIGAAAETTSGIDTLGADQVFAVQGQQVGDWNKNQLSVTGAVATSGNIQAGGSVKVGTDATCGATDVGKIHYNAATSKFEGCTPNGWMAFSYGSKTYNTTTNCAGTPYGCFDYGGNAVLLPALCSYYSGGVLQTALGANEGAQVNNATGICSYNGSFQTCNQCDNCHWITSVACSD